jgi:hypothetical protein
MAKKKVLNKYVIAVKGIDGLLNGLEKGNIRLPGKVEDYKKLFASSTAKQSEIKGLGKFIKKLGLVKKDCILYWEGLITDGYTLTDVICEGGDNALRPLCDGENIKYLTDAKK